MMSEIDNQAVHEHFSEKEVSFSFYCTECKKNVVHNDKNIVFVFVEEEKKDSKLLKGLKLRTYRVMHTHNKEMHINTIIVDDRVFYRATKDSFTLSKNETLELVEYLLKGVKKMNDTPLISVKS
jgi:hypothetical protein